MSTIRALFTYRTEVNSHLISMMKQTLHKLEKSGEREKEAIHLDTQSLRERIAYLENPQNAFSDGSIPFVLCPREQKAFDRLCRRWLDIYTVPTEVRALAQFVVWCGGARSTLRTGRASSS